LEPFNLVFLEAPPFNLVFLEAPRFAFLEPFLLALRVAALDPLLLELRESLSLECARMMALVRSSISRTWLILLVLAPPVKKSETNACGSSQAQGASGVHQAMPRVEAASRYQAVLVNRSARAGAGACLHAAGMFMPQEFETVVVKGGCFANVSEFQSAFKLELDSINGAKMGIKC
jgi:hypothetical protein